MIRQAVVLTTAFLALAGAAQAGPVVTDHRGGPVVTDHRGNGPVVRDHRGNTGPVVVVPPRPTPPRGPFQRPGDPTDGRPPVVTTQNPPKGPGVIVDPCQPGQCGGGHHHSWNSRGFLGVVGVPASYVQTEDCFFEQRRLNGFVRLVKVCAE
jgi:hypothetical protein